MATIEQLAQILQMLMSNNNTFRRNAEKQFETLTQNEYVLSTLSHLLAILRTAHAEAIIRVFAAVLMRRVVEKVVEQLPAQEVLRLKHEFLDCWQSLTDLKLSTKMSHVLAQMAFKHAWPELLPAAIHIGMCSKCIVNVCLYHLYVTNLTCMYINTHVHVFPSITTYT